MLPSDDLRHSLLEAMKQVETLCVNFGYKPVEDLRRLVTNTVKKAVDSKLPTVQPRMTRFFDDVPFLITTSAVYPTLQEQFKQKYIQIIKNRVMPAIRTYYDVHPNIDLHIFEPVINIKVTPITTLSNLAMGEVLNVVAEVDNWNAQRLAFSMDKTMTAWKQGRPIASRLTANQVNQMLIKEDPDAVDFMIQGFPESLPKETVERDLRLAFRRIENAIKNTSYKITETWRNRIVKGNTFPLSFVITITK